MQSPPPVNQSSPRTTNTNINNSSTQNKKFPPYTTTFKNLQQSDQVTDRKLIEYLVLGWKNKNGYELDITGRFGHEKCLLIFANNESTFEELFNQQKWPTKINESEFEFKVPRVLPSSYSLVIQQFFNSWNITEVLEDLKSSYPSLINLTKMISIHNKPLNLVRADFCQQQQVKRLLNEGRITIGHMKNQVKQYHLPAKISKCMKCYSHQHITKECPSPVQLCIRCGQNHPFNNNCQNEIHCANCGQDHYAGHSACPEVQQIRRQINLNQKEKRTQLLINLEQDQHFQYNNNNNQPSTPLSTPIQQHQQQYQERHPSRPHTYASVAQIQTQHQQKASHKDDRNLMHIENILTTFSNKIEYRLQQFEERLINQVIDVEKKVDNLKVAACELETLIYETILPAIKTFQECTSTKNQDTLTRENLTKYKNAITMLLTTRNNNCSNTSLTNSLDNRTQYSSTTTTLPTSSILLNDNE